MFNTIVYYVLTFFLYSMVGWTVESTYRSLGEQRVINSGFLYGPMCPIYGTGVLVFEIILVPLSQPFEKRWWLVLLLGMVCADTVEYLTSFIMEKLFNARWWDYTDEFLNLHGRICFKHTLYWALASFLYVYLVSPVYTYLISFIPVSVRPYILLCIFAVFLFDLIMTVKAAADIKKLMSKMKAIKLNLSLAGEALMLTAETIKNSAENRVNEFQESFSANTEKFNSWKSEVSEQFKDLRHQLDELGTKQKTDEYSRSVKRLYRNNLNRAAGKNMSEIENMWEDIKAKFKNDNDEML